MNKSYHASRWNITHDILDPIKQCNQRFTLTGDSPDNGMFPGEHWQAHYGALYLTE